MEEQINFDEILSQMNSEDSAERLSGVEQVMYDDLPDEVLVKMCSFTPDSRWPKIVFKPIDNNFVWIKVCSSVISVQLEMVVDGLR